MRKVVFLMLLLVANYSGIFAQYDSSERIIPPQEFTEGDSLDMALQSPKLTLIPEKVFNMTNLRILDLSFNRIGTINPKILNLTKLETIYLSGNQYLTSLPDFLTEMKSLKTIYLEGMGTWSKAKKQETVNRFEKKGIRVITE